MPAHQTKYKSHSAFQYGVANVNEILTDVERMILYALAVAVDYRNATSRPGNATLMRQSNRKIRTVEGALRSLRRKGLIEMESEGNGGRGLATVHRFRVEDDRYPKPRNHACGDSETKPRNNDCADTNKKPRNAMTETPQSETRNPATIVAPLPIKPSSPPSTGNGGGGFSQSKAIEYTISGEEADEIFDKIETATAAELGTPIPLSRKTRTALLAHFGSASREMVLEAFKRVLRRDQGWQGIKNRQAIVLAEFPACLRAVMWHGSAAASKEFVPPKLNPEF